MNITLNGAAFVTDCADLAALVDARGLDSSSLVIEHNRQVIKQDDWANTPVREGDTIELLNFVGGG
ncbi:MAG TPA: thiamine biosynthesis protein ThiS [Desulfobacteraceae bacterium]|nr:thiamine biosynthesis protein ThiS [Desulfobacteraceae bacterium]|tara:strand:- start:1254 stop:1451 length:198 start_codon:yes stop_codon:yes gene_type:complete